MADQGRCSSFIHFFHSNLVIIVYFSWKRGHPWHILTYIQPTISLEMPVPSQSHYGFHSFRLLTDFVCLYNYEFGLSLCKIVRSSVILLLPLLLTLSLFIQFLLRSRSFPRQRIEICCRLLHGVPWPMYTFWHILYPMIASWIPFTVNEFRPLFTFRTTMIKV